MLLEGKAAIVTGAGRGIGRAIAGELARNGARVLVNDYGVGLTGSDPSAEPAESASRAICDAGGEAVASADSVASSEGARRIVEACLDAYGRVDILVNVAAVLMRNLVVDTTDEEWDRQSDVILRGTFLCCREAAPHMIESGWGRIVNTTSIGALGAMPGGNAYAAAKEGVVGFTVMLARELCFHGITANVIEPRAATRMFQAPMPDGVRRRSPGPRDGLLAARPRAPAARGRADRRGAAGGLSGLGRGLLRQWPDSRGLW